MSEIEGWLTAAQAARLAACASRPRPAGAVVEIGSFRGRSTVVLARAAGAVVAIDPHAGSDRGPQEIAADASRGDDDYRVFHANLAAAGVAIAVRHVRKFSADALGDVSGPISLLYVDGAHRFGPAREDLHDWGARVVAGRDDARARLVLVDRRDARAVHRCAGGATPAGPARSRSSAASPGACTGRWSRQLPWFARNVAIKVLVVAGRRSWAERIGLDPAAPWPY